MQCIVRKSTANCGWSKTVAVQYDLQVFFVSIVCLRGSVLMYVLMFLRLSSPLTSVIQESLGRKVHSLSCNSTWSWEIWCGPTKVESCLSPSRDSGTSARFPPGVCVMRKKTKPYILCCFTSQIVFVVYVRVENQNVICKETILTQQKWWGVSFHWVLLLLYIVFETNHIWIW